jgi:hypothetical protein
MKNVIPADENRDCHAENSTHYYFLPAMAMDFLYWRECDIETLRHLLSQNIERFRLKTGRSPDTQRIPNHNKAQEK